MTAWWTPLMASEFWIPFLTASVTPVTAFAAVYFGYQQWRTNADRLRVELYDRRMNVLRGVLAHIENVTTLGRAEVPSINELSKLSLEAGFLVDRKIIERIAEIKVRS